MANPERNKLDIYDDVADLWWSDDIRWVRTLKNLVPGRLSFFDQHIDWQGKRILDVGCAGGFMSEAIAKKGASVTGIDPAQDAIAAAREHAAGSGLDVRYNIGVGEELPYDDGEFDAVVCVDVLEHVADLSQTISEISRVLKPGGTFAYDTINRNPIARFATITIAEDVLRLLPQGTHDPNMYIRPSELLAEFDKVGLLPGPITGLGPRGINGRGDPVFGTFPLKLILYMGIATKKAAG